MSALYCRINLMTSIQSLLQVTEMCKNVHQVDFSNVACVSCTCVSHSNYYDEQYTVVWSKFK